jgi:hypothetical protein
MMNRARPEQNTNRNTHPMRPAGQQRNQLNRLQQFRMQDNRRPGADLAFANRVGATSPSLSRVAIQTTGTQNGNRGALRNVIATLTPTERGAALAYVAGLTEDQRRALYQTITRTPANQQAKTLNDFVKSGRAPSTARDVLARVGAKPAGELAPIVMNNRDRKEAPFAIRVSADRQGLGTLPMPGSKIPVTIPTLGDRKYLVLQTGSITSPRYRASIPAARQLAETFGDRVQLVTIYTRESHPSDTSSPLATGPWVPLANHRDNVLLPQATSEEVRQQRADLLRQRYADKAIMVVDDLRDSKWQALGGRAHALIVTDPDGLVIHSSDPADFKAATQALNQVIGLSAGTRTTSR